MLLMSGFCSQGSPMLIGEMDSSGSLNAHALLHLSEQLRAKAVFQVVYTVTRYKSGLSSLSCQRATSYFIYFPSSLFQTVQSQYVTWQFETEYRGSDFTAAVTMANPDIFRESGAELKNVSHSHFTYRLLLHYYQIITRNHLHYTPLNHNYEWINHPLKACNKSNVNSWHW